MSGLDLQRTRAEVILTELDLVGTFLRIAKTSPNQQTRERNRLYAQEAYAMARSYLTQWLAPSELNRAIEEKFAEVQRDLQDAGEPVTTG